MDSGVGGGKGEDEDLGVEKYWAVWIRTDKCVFKVYPSLPYKDIYTEAPEEELSPSFIETW